MAAADGSLLTKKIDPDDSDILVVIQGAFYDAATGPQMAAIEWLKTDLYSGYFCHSHVLVTRPAGHPEFTLFEWANAFWIRQFGFSRKDQPKGIATIKTPLP